MNNSGGRKLEVLMKRCLFKIFPGTLEGTLNVTSALPLLKRVPVFEKMDEQVLDAMCDRLKPVLYTEESDVVREGDLVDEMLFVMKGKLSTTTTNGGRTDVFIAEYLEAEVEAFALMADDLKFVASQFRQLHSKQLRHTLRFHSQQWRTWAACSIQAAWRRYSKEEGKSLSGKEENRLQDALAKANGSSPMLVQKPAEPDFTSGECLER
ncbi:hypothetical protein OIU76_000987 [Salix suchowensis]|nr:hypothetical protein OIU76_000987 [Salix suchowensis]